MGNLGIQIHQRYTEPITKSDEWLDLEMYCPYDDCLFKVDQYRWLCQRDGSPLYINCNGIIECSDGNGLHSGRAIDWVFIHDQCYSSDQQVQSAQFFATLPVHKNFDFKEKLYRNLTEQLMTEPKHNCSLHATTQLEVICDGIFLDVDEEGFYEKDKKRIIQCMLRTGQTVDTPASSCVIL